VPTLDALFDWLVDGAPRAPNPVALLDRLLPALGEAGVPVDRAEAFVRTLHPHIVGRSFFWKRGSPVEVRENTYAYLNSPEFLDGPVGRVFREACVVQQPGFAAFPLRFTNGQVHAITFGTSEAGGFTAGHVAALERLVRPLSRLAEIFALARTAANLLSTYVGRGAGDRILSGQIRRGDTETIRCAIWFSDLRGFTPMSESREPGEIIRVLNDFFECQVPSIERHGGEVLKFMGDGILGIVPVRGDEGDACARALRAYDDASAELERLNRRKGTDLRFGLALHLGDVAYGNVGGASRLDFTCIGPAVNFAARIEGLTGKLGRTLLMSAPFAERAGRSVIELGRHALKGMSEPQPLHGLA
jgi:adenylate cyclase